MKRIMSTSYSTAAFNIATLFLRAIFGILIFLTHGLVKLNKFSEMQNTFPDPLHVGHRFSLILVIFAEVVCSLLLVLGLFSRFAALVLFIDVTVAIFFVHLGQPVDKFEVAILHSVVYFSLVLIGPGKISVDGMSGR
ncbi:MAG TPA: DoxX family protein [Puia sp.]|nr:DoxX family protein [Puia sp.]